MLYHSGHIFLIARRAHERSKNDDSEAMPAIVLSTVALECFVNETIHRVSNGYGREPVEVYSKATDWLDFIESKRSSTLEKIEALHLAFKSTKINRGAQPYQNLMLLYQLRNELVHRKPEGFGNWDPSDHDREYKPHKFVSALASEGVIDLPPPKAPPVWGQFVLKEKTAKWAFNTAVSGVHFIVNLLPDPESDFAQITNLMVDTLEKID